MRSFIFWNCNLKTKVVRKTFPPQWLIIFFSSFRNDIFQNEEDLCQSVTVDQCRTGDPVDPRIFLASDSFFHNVFHKSDELWLLGWSICSGTIRERVWASGRHSSSNLKVRVSSLTAWDVENNRQTEMWGWTDCWSFTAAVFISSACCSVLIPRHDHSRYNSQGYGQPQLLFHLIWRSLIGAESCIFIYLLPP